MTSVLEAAILETPGVIEAMLGRAQSAAHALRSEAFLRELDEHDAHDMALKDTRLQDAIQGLKRCAALGKQFLTVARDHTIQREVRATLGSNEDVLKVPLVFGCEVGLDGGVPILPKTVTMAVQRRPPTLAWWMMFHSTVTSRTPQLPAEALKAIQVHASKFDHLELWWVPNEVLVEKVFPDPILVGCVVPFKTRQRDYCREETPGLFHPVLKEDYLKRRSKFSFEPVTNKEFRETRFYFQLHRWVDESVESLQMAKEAY